MGGPGSGNWFRWDRKAVVEESWTLDLRILKKHGGFKSDKPSIYFLSSRTQRVAFRVQKLNETLHVSVYLIDGSQLLPVTAREVQYTTTPCHYGGGRWWLVCPCRSCLRRCVALFLYQGEFYCRRCLNLGYYSQRGGVADHIIERAARLRRKLGASESLQSPLPPRPRYMRKVKYQQLIAEIEETEFEWCDYLDSWMASRERA